MLHKRGWYDKGRGEIASIIESYSVLFNNILPLNLFMQKNVLQLGEHYSLNQ